MSEPSLRIITLGTPPSARTSHPRTGTSLHLAGYWTWQCVNTTLSCWADEMWALLEVPLQCGLGLERYCNSVVDLGVIHDMIAV